MKHLNVYIHIYNIICVFCLYEPYMPSFWFDPQQKTNYLKNSIFLDYLWKKLAIMAFIVCPRIVFYINTDKYFFFSVFVLFIPMYCKKSKKMLREPNENYEVPPSPGLPYMHILNFSKL